MPPILLSKPLNSLGDEAASTILSMTPHPSPPSLSIDPLDPLVAARWLEGGDLVAITPTDAWKAPQLGQLVGLTSERVSITIQVPNSERTIVGHFPRLGYKIERADGENCPIARL